MSQHVIAPEQFLTQEVFRQDDFLAALERHDFTRYQDAQVLIRGCTSTIIPPWALMSITAKLVPIAKTIRFGNEHDHVVIYRNSDNQPAK